MLNLKAVILKLIARKRNNEPLTLEKLSRILIVRQAKIGDTICLYPMIRELQKACPACTIDMYAGKDNSFMFKDVKEINRVYIKHRHKHPIKALTQLVSMRRQHYDLVIDTQEIKFGKILSLTFIKPRWLIGNEGYESRYGIRHCDLNMYDRLSEWHSIHTSYRMLGFLDLIGINNYDDRMGYPINEASMQFADKFTQPYKNTLLIGINIDASDTARSVSDDDFISIYNKLLAHEGNLTILMFCTADRRAHFHNLAQQYGLKKLVLEDGTKGFFDAAAIVNFVDVMISTDTSFIHVASALDTPTVGIFQNDAHHLDCWGPRSSQHAVVTPAEPGKSTSGFDPDEVVTSVFAMLDNKHAKSP